MNKKDCAIFDIDGTLSNATKRVEFVKSKPKNWLAFYKGMSNDEPILPVVNFLISTASRMDVLLLTGRPEEYRTKTEDWLKHHGIYHYITNLYMRKHKDNRTDFIAKMEIADEIEKNYKINFVVEDRASVINAWKQRGIFVFNVDQNPE